MSVPTPPQPPVPPPLHYRPHSEATSSHQRILSLVRSLAMEPILDVGAAQGMLGQALSLPSPGVVGEGRGGGSVITIDAVEPNPAWAAAAGPYYRQVFPTTVENAPLPPRTYRLIVCGDVLEHTVDPVAVLRQLRSAANADGVYIISVPNVAHLSVRLLLLLGLFPPMERGILDKTHLHFYTRATAISMLRQAGLRVDAAYPTGVPLSEICRCCGWLRKPLGWCQRAALAIAPRLFAFQWILVARNA